MIPNITSSNLMNSSSLKSDLEKVNVERINPINDVVGTKGIDSEPKFDQKEIFEFEIKSDTKGTLTGCILENTMKDIKISEGGISKKVHDIPMFSHVIPKWLVVALPASKDPNGITNWVVLEWLKAYAPVMLIDNDESIKNVSQNLNLSKVVACRHSCDKNLWSISDTDTILAFFEKGIKSESDLLERYQFKIAANSREYVMGDVVDNTIKNVELGMGDGSIIKIANLQTWLHSTPLWLILALFIGNVDENGKSGKTCQEINDWCKKYNPSIKAYSTEKNAIVRSLSYNRVLNKHGRKVFNFFKDTKLWSVDNTEPIIIFFKERVKAMERKVLKRKASVLSSNQSPLVLSTKKARCDQMPHTSIGSQEIIQFQDEPQIGVIGNFDPLLNTGVGELCSNKGDNLQEIADNL